MDDKYDFSGWATRSKVRCTDGRTILPDAFKNCNDSVVPLVWNHQHNDPNNILGHALLKSVGGDVYAYCSFNDSESGKAAKVLVEHGDITSLSILANQLVQKGSDVVHGVIREVSLVLAGANPKAFIDEVICHSDDTVETAIIYFDEPIELAHASSEEEKKTTVSVSDKKGGKEEIEVDEETKKTSDGKEETIADVFATLTDKQKTVVYALVGEALSEKNDTDEDETEGGKEMKHNVFDTEETQKEGVLSHDAIDTIIGDAKRYGSMKESVLQHSATYGIDQIEYLFPEAENVTNTPQFIERDRSWVQQFMGRVHHTPFSRIKSMFADITEDEARALGYIKGKLKKEEVFSLLKRTTTPTTIYKKQKMDRDDVIDITDFDVIAWLKTEMRWMLDEEIARAALVGDGRLSSSDDKINETSIRPIWTDADLYTIKTRISVANGATADDKAKAFIRAVIKSRKDYKGSGNPVLFTTEDVLTDCLLLTDGMGRDLYETVDKLKTKLRVSDIITVPVMEGLKHTVTENSTSKEYELYAILVNPVDYNIGADKGGAINMFDDFDIDYNQQKYLIETRCSGALIKPYSAIAVEIYTEPAPVKPSGT